MQENLFHSPEEEQRIQSLRKEILRHNNLYYNEANPIISDGEYDALFRELETLEKKFPHFVIKDSPTQKVGSEKTEGFFTEKHQTPMLSIDDIFEQEQKPYEELLTFYQRLEKEIQTENFSLTLEPKIDGVAVSLLYKGGELEKALSRGDGVQGDNITENIKTISSIPERIPAPADSLLEIRGEIFITNADFEKLNCEQREKGRSLFSNPRNATAGTIKLLDSKKVKERPLCFLAHSLGLCEEEELESELEFRQLLEKYQISHTEIQIVETREALMEKIQHFKEKRKKLAYNTDGLVIKVNDFAIREALGSTHRSPRWAVAYKYLSPQAKSIIKDITIQVGRTGILTPVAELETVFLDGSNISRATLHNEEYINGKPLTFAIVGTPSKSRNQIVEKLNKEGFQISDEVNSKTDYLILGKKGDISEEQIKVEKYQIEILQEAEFKDALQKIKENGERKQIRIGDLVKIRKAGDIIPEVIGIHSENKRSAQSQKFNFFEYVKGECPSCSFTIQKREEFVGWFCNNPLCPDQKIKCCIHFVSRKGLDITGLDEKVVKKLFERGVIDNDIDLFSLNQKELETLQLDRAKIQKKKENTPDLFQVKETQKYSQERRLGRKNAILILEGIEKAKSAPLHKWIFAIGISQIGESTSVEISRLFKTFERLFSSSLPSQIYEYEKKKKWIIQNPIRNPKISISEEELEKRNLIRKECISQIKEFEFLFKEYQISSEFSLVASKQLCEFIESEMGRKILKKMKDLGINPQSANYNPKPKKSKSILKNLIFVITGKLDKSRIEIKNILEENGAKVTNKVTRVTDFLIQGKNEDPSSKELAARKFQTSVLSEKVLFEFIERKKKDGNS